MKDPFCLRCGKCCVLPSGKDCRFLVRFGNGLTACRVYATRLGRDIGEGCVCLLRKEQGVGIAGCPVFRDVFP